MIEINIPIYAALLSALLLFVQNLLMLNVGMYRTSLKKGVGVDGDIKLERLVRRHGNLAENAAIFVITLALFEMQNGQTDFAFWVAAVFGLSRIMHLVGFSNEAGSHLIGAEGGKKFFLALRAGGATLSALSSIGLGLTFLFLQLN